MVESCVRSSEASDISDLLVIVPAFNEEDSIGAVVNDALTVLGADVLVVDDGSSDATADCALTAGATVLSHPFNLGVGGAIRTALRYAVAHGYERVVQMDGDGQHQAVEAKLLLEALREGADLVVGSRFASGYEVSRARRIPMRLLSRTISRRLGTPITDTTSGFRAMSTHTIRVFSHSYPWEYLSDTVEALLLAADAKLVVTEVDVRMRVRQGGVASASTLRSMYHLVRLFLVVALHSLRRPQEMSDSEVI